MNFVLFKMNLRNNYAILLFITLMLLMYTTISVGMFDPDNADTMEAMLNMMPESLIKAFGFEGLGTEMTAYLSNYLFGFIYLIFPVIYTVIVSNSLVAKHVDSGSMTYLLTTPNTRKVIARTQAGYLISSTFTIFAVNTGIALVMSEIMFPGHLDGGAYLMLNLVTFLCLFVISGIGFFFSCLFNETRSSLAFGAAIPVMFIVVKMISGISESLSFLKYLTLYTLVDIDKILAGGTYPVAVSAILLTVGSIIYFASVELFNRRSLSL